MYCIESSFQQFLRYSELLVENCDIFTPHLCLAAPQGVTPPEFREDLSTHKTRMNGLSCGDRRKHDNNIFSRFDTVPACYRQTDRRMLTHVKTELSLFDIAYSEREHWPLPLMRLCSLATYGAKNLFWLIDFDWLIERERDRSGFVAGTSVVTSMTCNEGWRRSLLLRRHHDNGCGVRSGQHW